MPNSYGSLRHCHPTSVTGLAQSKRDELSENPGAELKWKSPSTLSVSCDVSAGEIASRKV